MSRRPRRRLIPSATAPGSFCFDSWKNRSFGAGAVQVGDALHPKRPDGQPLFTERVELPSDQPKHFEAASGIEPLLRVLQTVTTRYQPDSADLHNPSRLGLTEEDQ